MLQTATNTFYNREQEREAKAQERERRKETRHAQMLTAFQGSFVANPESLKDKALDKCLSQGASDIRIKLQQLLRQDPSASLDELVQTATSTFYNREQEREAKAQEREKRKEKRHTQLLAALQGSPMVTLSPSRTRHKANA